MNLAEMSALSFRAAEAGPDVKVMPSNGEVPTLAGVRLAPLMTAL